MKVIECSYLCIFFFVVGCSNNASIGNNSSKLIDSSRANISSTGETEGNRQYYDSAHFSVILGKYVTGEKYLECYQNKLNKLDSWKLYFKNGMLKEEGVMTNGNHIYIGIWKYYSPEGKLDSVINYDKVSPISYFKAIEITRTRGYVMPNVDVRETVYKNKKYWQIDKWKANPDRNGATAETILIEKKTGKVIKPDFTMTMIY